MPDDEIGGKAFSTSAQQMDPASQEGLHFKVGGKEQDRRNYVDFKNDENKLSSYECTVQIEGLDCNGGRFVGSGSAVNRNGIDYIYTCAHNIIGVSPLDGKKVPYTDLTAYRMRKGPDVYESKYLLTQTAVHPKYDGKPGCGFDIAVCRVGKKLPGRNATATNYSTKKSVADSFAGSIAPNKLKEGTMVQVAGYPGEKAGLLYEHSGPVAQVIETELGGYVLTYKLDTTPGNSGSKVMVVDETIVKQYPGLAAREQRYKDRGDEHNFQKMIIGIHTGSDYTNQVNFGTLITPEIKKWLNESMDKMK